MSPFHSYSLSVFNWPMGLPQVLDIQGQNCRSWNFVEDQDLEPAQKILGGLSPTFKV